MREVLAMAKVGRPKEVQPYDRSVTVRFKGSEYELLLEQAQRHNMTISQLVRYMALKDATEPEK